MRIVIVTDAWAPQVNGVVRSLQAVKRELEQGGDQVTIVSPDLFASLPCPTYPEIRLALARTRSVGERIERAAPDAVHIATEGPLGLAARRWCLHHGIPFTSAYHTQFPEYLARRTGAPQAWFWRYIRWFHGPAEAVLVATPTLARQLSSHGLPRTRLWGRGVDLSLFSPLAAPHPALAALPRPIHLHVGRLAVEKNVDAFLALDIEGSKVVVGDGPDLARLKREYPSAHFLGMLRGSVLASAYRTADVLVFPSRTDTFGLVMIEALACGTPVAAFPVPGPIDVLGEGCGAMNADLAEAARIALSCDRSACALYGKGFSWSASARQFRDSLSLLPGGTSKAFAAG